MFFKFSIIDLKPKIDILNIIMIMHLLFYLFLIGYLLCVDKCVRSNCTGRRASFVVLGVGIILIIKLL